MPATKLRTRDPLLLTSTMKSRLNCLQQQNASIWSITSQIVDDCELIIGQLREITRASQPDSSLSLEGSTTAVATTPLMAGKKRSFSTVNESKLPELRSSRSLLQKYTISGADRTKRVHMIEHLRPARCKTSTPLKNAKETDPFCSPDFDKAPKRGLPQVITSDGSSF